MQCSRCNQDISTRVNMARIWNIRIGMRGPYDVCDKCADQIEEFIKRPQDYLVHKQQETSEHVAAGHQEELNELLEEHAVTGVPLTNNDLLKYIKRGEYGG